MARYSYSRAMHELSEMYYMHVIGNADYDVHARLLTAIYCKADVVNYDVERMV